MEWNPTRTEKACFTPNFITSNDQTSHPSHSLSSGVNAVDHGGNGLLLGLSPMCTMNTSIPSLHIPSPDHERATFPRRRQHAVQPPTLLTSTLENAHNASWGTGILTPLSTTSLSSPFSIHQPSPYPLSPAGAMRGTSPSLHQAPAAFSAPYNPQQWGPLSGTSTSSSPASRPLGMRQANSSTRVAMLAARPVGPDGMSRCSQDEISLLTLFGQK